MYQSRIALAIIFFVLAGVRIISGNFVLGITQVACGVLLLETARLYKLLEAK